MNIASGEMVIICLPGGLIMEKTIVLTLEGFQVNGIKIDVQLQPE